MSRYSSGPNHYGRSLESMRNELEDLLNRRKSPERYPKVMPSTAFKRGLEDIKRGYGFSESERLSNHNKLQAALSKNRELEHLLQANIIEHDRVVKALNAKLESQSGFQSRLGSDHISLYGLKQEMESRLRALEEEWANVRSIILAQEQKYYERPQSSRSPLFNPQSSSSSANYSNYTMPSRHPEQNESVPLEKLLQSLMNEVKEDLTAHFDARFDKMNGSKRELNVESTLSSPNNDSDTNKKGSSDDTIAASLEKVVKSNEALHEKIIELSSTQHTHSEKLEELFSTQATQHEELSQKIKNQSEAITANSVTLSDRVAQFDQLVATKLAQMDTRLDEQQNQQLQYQQLQQQMLQQQQQQQEEDLYAQQELYNRKNPSNFDATIATPPLTRDAHNSFTPRSVKEPRPYQQSSINEGSKFSTSGSGSSLATSTPNVQQRGLLSPDIVNLDEFPNNKSADAKRIEKFAYDLRHGLIEKDRLDQLYNVYYNSPQILKENPDLLNRTRHSLTRLERELGPRHRPILESIQREL